MAIEFDCPACGGTLRVGDDTAGQVVRCGGCMTMLRVPDAATPPTPPPPTFPTAASPYPPEGKPLPPRPPRREPEEEPHPEDLPDDRPPRSRRRRRVRRPPLPAHKGRSPLFWVGVALGMIGVFMLGCCGLALLLMPKPEWQTHD